MKSFIAYLAILIVFMILTSYLSIASLNPFGVYVFGSVTAKVFVSLFGGMLTLAMLGFLGQLGSMKSFMKPFIWYLTILIVFMILTSYLSISSLNPFDVYVSDGVADKVFVSLFGGILALAMLGFMGQSITRITIRRATGRPAEDARCPGCGHPLLAYISAYGPPIICRDQECHRPWHLSCFKREPEVELPPNYRFPNGICPECKVKQAKAQVKDLDRWLAQFD